MDIRFQNISILFNEKTIIDNLSFEVKSNQKAVLIGHSGSGKTSLLNALLGFVKPINGSIFVNNILLDKTSKTEIRKNFAWVPQELNLTNINVREFIQLPFKFHQNKNIKPTEDNIEKLLNQFLLDVSLLDKSLNELSVGEKQRIALVTCILLKRPILLFDELTSALDSKSKKAVMDFVFNLKDTTILSTSHDEEWIERCEIKIKV